MPQLLPDDWEVFGLPLPEPRIDNITSLAESLRELCSNFVHIQDVDLYEREFAAFAAKIIRNNADLSDLASQGIDLGAGGGGVDLGSASDYPPFLGPSTTTANAASATLNAVGNFFKRVVLRKGDSIDEAANAARAARVSATTSAMIVSDAELKEFQERRMKGAHDLLLEAIQLLKRWLNLVQSLSLQRHRVLSTRIYRSEWRSSLDKAFYNHQCIRFHSAMFGHLVACLAFNLGRRCELYCAEEFKDYYQYAVRTWDQVVLRELLIFNPRGTVMVGNMPPEISSPDACVFFMRLAISKLQHAAIQRFLTTKRLVTDELVDASDSTVFEFESSSDSTNVNKCTPSHPFGTDVKRQLSLVPDENTTTEANLAVGMRLCIQLLVQLQALWKAPHLLLDASFPLSPSISEKRVVRQTNLRNALKQMELYARSNLLILGYAYFYRVSASEMAGRCLGYLKCLLDPSVKSGGLLGKFVSTYTVADYYQYLWTPQLLDSSIKECTMFGGYVEGPLPATTTTSDAARSKQRQPLLVKILRVLKPPALYTDDLAQLSEPIFLPEGEDSSTPASTEPSGAPLWMVE